MSSLKVAEAAKVLENKQCNLNIALVKEQAIIFTQKKIYILDVLEAAGTNWKFLPCSPGLLVATVLVWTPTTSLIRPSS